MVELSRLRGWIADLARQSEGRLQQCRRQLLGTINGGNSTTITISPLPLTGCVSYAAFNLHIATSGLPGCGPTLARALLLTSHLGIGHHLYNDRTRWSVLPGRHRLLQTAYITVLFNLGSILFIAITKSYMPRLQLLRGAYALAASAALLYLGLDFLHTKGEQQQQDPPNAV
ncbi:hypothetical protein TYRP_007612 [Tyrophagus putrescentiae]|nr:hypothetical protein TYRP_007612 [Tyrophagus putrescentiae]